MKYKKIELFQSLISMLCHDLSDIAVTLDNCIGLLDNEEHEIKERAKEIISFESNNFINKIRFYRSVYGIVSGEKKIEISYINEILNNYISKKKITLEMDIKNSLFTFNGFLGRISIILFTIVVDTIGSSGEISYRIDSKNHKDFIQIIGISTSEIKNSQYLRDFTVNNKEHVNIYNCKEFFIREIINNFLPNYKIDIKLLDNKTIKYIIA